MPSITTEHPVQVGSTITNGSSAIRVTERVARDPRWRTSGWRGLAVPLEAFGGNAGMSEFVADYLLGSWRHVPFEWEPVVGGALEERYVWTAGYRRLQREVRPTKPTEGVWAEAVREDWARGRVAAAGKSWATHLAKFDGTVLPR